MNLYIYLKNISGFLLTILFLYILGVIVKNVIGKKIYQFFEQILSRIPFINKIYTTTKNITNTLSNSKEHISPHDHSQSNLSFAYYLKKQKGDSEFILIDKLKHNEFIPQLFTSVSADRNKIFKKRTTSNIARINIDPEEDDIIIFPSKTLHGTQKNTNNNERISISADVSILAKESKNLEHLTPPFSEWKKFTNN